MLGHPRIAVVAYCLPSKASWKLVLENETRQVTDLEGAFAKKPLDIAVRKTQQVDSESRFVLNRIEASDNTIILALRGGGVDGALLD